MLRYDRLRQSEILLDLIDGGLASGLQKLHDPQSHRVTNALEHVGGKVDQFRSKFLLLYTLHIVRFFNDIRRRENLLQYKSPGGALAILYMNYLIEVIQMKRSSGGQVGVLP